MQLQVHLAISHLQILAGVVAGTGTRTRTRTRARARRAGQAGGLPLAQCVAHPPRLPLGVKLVLLVRKVHANRRLVPLLFPLVPPLCSAKLQITVLQHKGNTRTGRIRRRFGLRARTKRQERVRAREDKRERENTRSLSDCNIDHAGRRRCKAYVPSLRRTS